MSVKPNPWHILEVGMNGEYVYGAVKPPEGCCTVEQPCQALRLYYRHPAMPAVMEVGLYRFRVNAFGRLDVERAVTES